MPTSDEEIMRQLTATFKIEADEHVQVMNGLLLKLEKEKDAAAYQILIEDIFREAHSLKGAARAVDADVIESIAHRIENVFAAAKRREIEPAPALYDLLYESLDAVAAALQALTNGHEPPGNVRGLIERLERIGQRRVKNGKPEKSKSKETKPSKTKAETAPVDQTGQGKGIPAAEATIRVSTKKLDALMIHVEELLVSKIRTEQRLAELKEVKGFLNSWQKDWLKTRGFYDRLRRNADNGPDKIVAFLGENQQNLKKIQLETNRLLQAFSKDTMRMSLITEDLQEDIRRVRMLPVSTIFSGFGRMVRDLAREQGKQVDLVISGKETELDKKVIEGIKDPLMHMLRNAVDHGIEKPNVRVAKGKAAQGTIRLRAGQEGGSIIIEVQDDGCGIDIEHVKNTALARGVINSREVKTISDEDTRLLIFRSGFSTASTISNVSGRGVGLDVVKSNIEQLNGLIDITSKETTGTRFTINLPLTLSTSRVLLINCGGETFAVPTSTVERIVRIKKSDIYTVGTKEAIDIGDRSLALVRLHELLELPAGFVDETDGKLSIVILGAAEKRVAFCVDSLEGETEIVIKSLGKMMSRVRNVSGATILGTGKVVVILNVIDMIKASKTYAHRRLEAMEAREQRQQADEKTILVVDDSITTRILEKNILESAGYCVYLANDGVEALQTLKTNSCDLIISDIDMPRMNGFDLTSKIKHDERLQYLPIVLVTALDSDIDRERGLEAGADAYMVKHDFNQKNLLDTIEQLV